ncbi:hypothetical protein GGH12_002972 [Coemansia sp. RSA 1822]|nr:hypothetical protein IW147_004287 [Coemansia sp. RSA 720]KAJ2562814.1 hypothetical protein GGH12_002972 [Coemansia sp. RSA 1822]
MNDEYASGAETPVSKSFQDTAFINFVHEADLRNNNSPLTKVHSSKPSNQPSKPARDLSMYEHGTHSKAAHTVSQMDSTGSKGKAGGSDSVEINDDDWDELDKLELDSQTMRQLIETEEEFYATQQFMMTELALSQEPTKRPETRMNARSASADGTHNTRTVPSPAAQSVPVTPTAQPIYISDGDSVQSNRGNAASGSFVPQQQQHSQSRPIVSRIMSANGTESATRKTNLYPRLAAHIPPRPPNSRRPQSSASEIRFDLSTSILSSPNTVRQTPQKSAQPNWPQPGASPQHVDSMAEEIRRLKEENARVLAEFETLQSRLYTKEGEVKIVRDNLARTEIENTQLQERLSNHISTAAVTREQAEAGLKTEIERLKTELLFQKHEAKTATIVQTPTRTVGTPRSAGVRRTDGVRSLSSGMDGYPDFSEFASTPKRVLTKAAVNSPATPKLHEPQKRDQSVSTNSLQSAELSAPLLDILSGISELSSTAFGGLISLAVQLSKTVRGAGSVLEFHDLSCTTLHHVSDTGSYEQLEAILQLLLQAVDRLSEIRDAWFLDRTECVDKNGDTQSRSAGQIRTSQLSGLVCETMQTSVQTAAKMRRRSRESVVCGRAIAAHVRLLVRVIGLQPSASFDGDTWTAFDPCMFSPHLTPGLHLHGLSAILDLLTALIQVSPHTWTLLRDAPLNFESLLLSVIKRLRLAFSTNEPRMLDTQRKFLVLIASAIVTHETDSKTLINTMHKFVRSLIQWFLDEHRALTERVDEKRVTVLCEHMKCLNVILSEVEDVVALLDGDCSPLFFAFVAATTRVTFGEAPFADPVICELAADLLAYVVTEEQAMAIQRLAEFP